MLWIDATDTFLHWKGSPTGIQRTLLGLARASEGRSDCKLCAFDEAAGVWRELPPDIFESLVLGQSLAQPEQQHIVRTGETWALVARVGAVLAFLSFLMREMGANIVAFAYQIAPFALCQAFSSRRRDPAPPAPRRPSRPLPSVSGHPLDFTRRSRRAKVVIDFLSAITPFFIVTAWHRFCRRNRFEGTAPRDEEAGRRSLLARFPAKEHWDRSEEILVADSHWNCPGFFEALRSGPSCPRVIGFCYDLIPLDRPDFVPELARQVFEKWILEMLSHSNEVVCISVYTAERLQRFVTERALNLPNLQRIRSVAFGNRIEAASRMAPVTSRRLGDILAENDVKWSGSAEVGDATGWMLWLGSLDVRKNLDVLLLAAEHCYSSGRCRQPLIIAGRPSTGFDFYANKMRNNPVLQRFVVHLNSPSDTLLADLQAGTNLFVFTSWEEGYGLPVAEALQMGVPVIASNATSIPEVAGPLVDYFEPWDSRKLSELLERFEADASYREDLRSRAKSFVSTSWDQTLSEIAARANPALPP